MAAMKGIKGMMMKPHSLIPIRNASRSSASFHNPWDDNSLQASLRNPWDDNPHHDTYNPNNNTLANANEFNKTKRFSLILPRSTESLSGMKKGKNLKKSGVILETGVVLLKNYVSVSDQVKIVNTCQQFGMGRGGFYQPITNNGGKMNLHMMCFGRNWDPKTKYNSKYRSDGSHALPLPHQLISLAETSIKDSQAYDDRMPSMDPDICVVNFYTSTGKLGLHQDRDESESSLKKGLPVVSISIGDSAKFLYGNSREVGKAKVVLLESGDVLIFGGKSRLVYHGVTKIIPNSAPLSLLQQVKLRPGRLNLTLRQY
ncbi:DNA N(6)-methyladenine demethylase ALKBH1D-like [Rutidosis leptorrhynchoides]|uniref:DNA N(6)-methyladenine demethylase ALKBH1D-like n=1 Tax=Rutidosis leptorrhynchoides TaxID=125765 RepID=UPI003A994E72